MSMQRRHQYSVHDSSTDSDDIYQNTLNQQGHIESTNADRRRRRRRRNKKRRQNINLDKSSARDRGTFSDTESVRSTFQTQVMVKPQEAVKMFETLEDERKTLKIKTTNYSKFLKKRTILKHKEKVQARTTKRGKLLKFISKYEQKGKRQKVSRNSRNNRIVLKELFVATHEDDHDIVAHKDEVRSEMMKELLLKVTQLVGDSHVSEPKFVAHMLHGKFYGWRLNQTDLLNSIK